MADITDDPKGKTGFKRNDEIVEPSENGHAKTDESAKSGEYFEDGDWLYLKTSDGRKKLANFTARIVEEILVDDGDDVALVFKVRLQQKLRVENIEIKSKEFSSLSWINEKCGASFVVGAGTGIKDHTRAAILNLSAPVLRSVVFSHTGWREVDGRWVYLCGGGAIAEDGIDPAIDVHLDKNLSAFAIPEPKDETECVNLSLKALRELAPMQVMAPLWGSVFVAPLTSALGGDAPDFVAWIHGPSGVMKSELVAVGQSHWGSFSRTQLPGSFVSTVNSVERQWFALKDALFTMDDYFPASNRSGADEMEKMIDKLTRGVGNRKGRDRMSADLKMRSGFPPRGMVAATSERQPSGHSGTARIFPIPVAAGAISTAVLSEMQAKRHLLSGAMFSYIKWLAARYPDILTSIQVDYSTIRSKVSFVGEHTRQVSQVSHLLLGLKFFIKFCVFKEVLNEKEGNTLFASALASITAGAGDASVRIAEQDPVNLSLALLRAAFRGGAIYVAAHDTGEAPGDYRAWGWKSRKISQYESETIPVRDDGFAGHINETHLYLLPDSAYPAILSQARKENRVFPVDKNSLERMWDERGVIERDGNRRKKLIRMGDQRVWCYAMYRHVLVPDQHPADDSDDTNSVDLG